MREHGCTTSGLHKKQIKFQVSSKRNTTRHLRMKQNNNTKHQNSVTSIKKCFPFNCGFTCFKCTGRLVQLTFDRTHSSISALILPLIVYQSFKTSFYFQNLWSFFPYERRTKFFDSVWHLRSYNAGLNQTLHWQAAQLKTVRFLNSKNRGIWSAHCTGWNPSEWNIFFCMICLN